MLHRYLLLLALLALSACQSPLSQLQNLSSQHAHHFVTQPTRPFPLAMSVPVSKPSSPRLRVYLEGDGRAWATASQPSLDPSPRDLLMARLAVTDPQPSLYLARPCQFVSAPACNPQVWTDQRFGQAVLDSLDQALNRVRAQYGNRDFELIGYSGGAALALLLAAQRNDIAVVQTLAGNLSPRQWAKSLDLTPLRGSLEPLDRAERLRHVAQRHFIGFEDRTVPPILYQHYRRTLGPADCLEVVRLPGVDHANGWAAAWAQWRHKPVRCAPQ
ncbi:hypothetical protein [Pseudomonas japonica]|uniref:Alpha/beta hydrolase n=1 Tax=Pseudomonas japonica TaxID=256466 RepID=A0A239BDJ9_9PSED|nr:hypothetical protein [Pseudomonas japonica]SNS05468.1 hypothetical protein SAMN05444352_102457 [Pseudomonas japonica]